MIRRAEHRDVPAIVQLGWAMHAESNFAPMRFDAGRVNALARYLIDNPSTGYLAVCEREDGELVGVIGGSLMQAWFSTELIANDFALYVMPKVRHSATALRLAIAFKAWALDNGAKQVRVGTAAGDAGQAANAIYEHLGYKRAGQAFVLDAPVVNKQPVAA